MINQLAYKLSHSGSTLKVLKVCALLVCASSFWSCDFVRSKESKKSQTIELTRDSNQRPKYIEKDSEDFFGIELDYSKFNAEDPCEFLRMEEILANFNLEGSIRFHKTKGNDHWLNSCEAHWQIGSDSVRIIRATIFTKRDPNQDINHLVKVAFETAENSNTVSQVKLDNEEVYAFYGNFNWNRLTVFASPNNHLVDIECEYRGVEPISEEEMAMRKELFSALANNIILKLGTES